MVHVWVQFKLEKLPLFCYNYRRVDHDQKFCKRDKPLVFPRQDKAIPKYDICLKVKTHAGIIFLKLLRK